MTVSGRTENRNSKAKKHVLIVWYPMGYLSKKEIQLSKMLKLKKHLFMHQYSPRQARCCFHTFIDRHVLYKFTHPSS